MNQLNKKIGEVQETPTPYTLLARLKDLMSGMVLAAGSAIIGKVGIDQTTDGTTNKVQARNATHGNFQVNATLQINDTDNAVGNPAFAQLTAGSAIVGAFKTDQTTHGTTDKVAADLYVGGAVSSATNPVSTQIIGNSTLIEGQVTMTGAAIQVGANTACKNVTIQAEPSNLGYVYIGRANTVTATVHMATLSAGSSYTFNVSNINLLYAFGTSGDKICYGGEV
jgi:hypothetical protein